MFDRLSPAARMVFKATQVLAREMDSGLVGEEHLLLALLEEPGLQATFGPLVSGKTELRDISRRLRTPRQAGEETWLPYTPQMKQSLEAAERQSLDRGDDYVGLRHLLLGLLSEAARDPDNLVARTFAEVDVDPAAAHAAVLAEPDAADARSAQMIRELDAAE